MIPTALSLPPLDYTSLPAFLAGAARWVEAALPRYLPDGEPKAFLYDLARDYPGRGGKRFRPALLLLSTALAGGDPRAALPSAVALELFQNFALVHDDIEDGSWMRRGRPALHRQAGVPLALNAGDLLFGLVFEALQDNEAALGAARALAVQREFSRVFRRTFEGQALDIGWIQANHFPTRAEFETMLSLKTGWYSGRGPCRIGALIGGAPVALASRCTKRWAIVWGRWAAHPLTIAEAASHAPARDPSDMLVVALVQATSPFQQVEHDDDDQSHAYRHCLRIH